MVAAHGQEQSRALFERLVVQIARREISDGRQVETRRTGGGDGGLDVVAGQIGGDVYVWQAKFPNRFQLGDTQRGAVRDALRAAQTTITDAGGRLVRWTLAIPFDLDPNEELWFDRQIRDAAARSGVTIELLGRSAIEARLTKPENVALLDVYFGPSVRSRLLVDPLLPASELSWAALRVARAAIGPAPLPAYVARSADAAVDRVLSDVQESRRQPLLLLGDAGTGKSRTAYEGIIRQHPSAQVFAPADSSAVRNLSEQLDRYKESGRLIVLWLDDLERWIDGSALTAADVEAAASIADAAVLATIRRNRFSEITERDSGGRAVLEVFGSPIPITNSLTKKERAAFAALHPAGAATGLGVGEYFLDVARLEHRLHANEATESLVGLAIDWHIATTGRPISETRLLAIYDGVYGEVLDATKTALADAARGDGNVGPLIERSGDGAVSVIEALVDRLDDAGRQISHEVWEAMLDVALPDEALTIGFTAARREAFEAAYLGLESALGSASVSGRATAHLVLGDLLAQRGRLTEAEEHWGAALASTAIAPEAASRLSAGLDARSKSSMRAAIQAAYEEEPQSGDGRARSMFLAEIDAEEALDRGETQLASDTVRRSLFGTPAENMARLTYWKRRVLRSEARDRRDAADQIDAALLPAEADLLDPHTATRAAREAVSSARGGSRAQFLSRYALTASLVRAGAALEAVAELKTLIADMSADKSTPAWDLMQAQLELAYAEAVVATDESDSRRLAHHACGRFQELGKQSSRLFGPGDEHTLNARHNEAFFMGRSGHAKHAVALYQDLLPDSARWRGALYAETLTIRHEIAFWTGEAGRPAEALARFEDLLPFRIAVMGERHDRTLLNRLHIIRLRRELGADAAADVQDLVRRCREALGEQHPVTARAEALL